MLRQLPGFCVAIFLGGVCHGQEKSVEDWAKELGGDDPAVRRKAEAELAAAGIALEALARHPDPWIAARATRLMMAQRGIDTRLPLRLQIAVYGFSDLDETQRTETLGEITKQGPGHLNALAYLLGREADGQALSEADSALWRQRLMACIATNSTDVHTLRPELLSAPLRAFVLACFAERSPDKTKERYAKWRALDPSIRIHLNGRQVALEIEHLKQEADTAALLGYLPLILDNEARRQASGLLSETVSKDVALKPETFEKSAAVGHLMTLMARGGVDSAMPWFLKHFVAHPGITGVLPPELSPLEAARLLKTGQPSQAIALIVKPLPGDAAQSRIDENLLRGIGNALGAKPETLPDGLPVIDDARSLPMMGRLLASWFSMTSQSSANPGIDAKVECFDRWAKTGEWLEAARRFGPRSLYHLVMSRRGKTAEALLTYEFERDREALRNLGTLILLRPAIAAEIPARQCSEGTLREILDGGLANFGMESPPSGPLFDLAAGWSGIHPELLADGSFPTQPIYQAVLDWRAGEHGRSAAALLACTKPLPVDPLPGQVASPNGRPNPLAFAATLLLTDLLSEHSGTDLHLLLPAEQAGPEILQSMLRRLGRPDKPALGQVRAAMAIAVLLRERHSSADSKFLFSSHDALSFALEAWMAGDEKLAADFLIQAYLTSPDPEEKYDSILAPALNLLDRASEALDALDAAEGKLSAPIRLSKRARLLRELGRTKEAMDTVSPKHHPQLLLRLAIETEDWEAAIRSTLDVEDDEKKREAMQACIAMLSGIPRLINRHTPGKHAVLNLLKGNGIREDDLAAMARDTELLARLEGRLTASLASGDPVLLIDMYRYFQYLDLLPDKNRAALLAVELAKRDTCVTSSPNSGEKLTVHKVLAAETLLLLGRGELAFAAMRPLMEASVEPHEFKQVANGVVFGGHILTVTAGYRQAVRIAHFEWPDESAAGRMDRLGAILETKNPLERARGMIGLIAKHQARLKKTDLLQALRLAFLDLAHAAEVPDDLKQTARDLAGKHQPDERENRWLESMWARVPWQEETTHRPFEGKATSDVSFSTKPGGESDPKKSGFVILDGLSAVTRLQQQGEADAARALLRDVVLRVLLDYDLRGRQKAEWDHRTNGPAGSRGSSFQTNGLLTVLTYIDLLAVPTGGGLIDASANPWTNYSDTERLLHAARAHQEAGDLPAALACHRRFIIATIPPIGSEDVYMAGRMEVAEMQRVRGMAAVAAGDSATAVEAFRQLLRIAPYQPDLTAEIASGLKDKSDAAAIASARAAIDDFWRVRLLEIPSSETYRHWKDVWEKLFP